MRILSARDPAEAAQLLERLKNSWSGKNQLRIHTPPEVPAGSKEPAQEEKKPAEDKKQPDRPAVAKDQVADLRTLAPLNGHPLNGRWQPNRPWLIQFAMFSEEAKESSPAESDSNKTTDGRVEHNQGVDSTNGVDHNNGAAPIDIIVMPDGRILLQGGDPAALDELEYLIHELAPPQDEFAVFELSNSRASLVVLNLEEYFADELKGQMEAQYSPWGGYRGMKNREEGPISLSARPLLRFIYDIDTNTIVAQNASPAQLRTIQRLIDIYDRPPNEDSVMARRTEAIKIRYSRATDIANALKEVYRDLLSSKDKEFQGKDGQGKSRTETYYRIYGSAQTDSNKKKPSAIKVAFEGAISIGVDELSNTLIISAQDDVWDSVHELVLQLDKAAIPNTEVQVREVRGIVSTDALQQALSKALGTPWIGGKPQQVAGQKGGKGKGENQPENGDKGREAKSKNSE